MSSDHPPRATHFGTDLPFLDHIGVVPVSTGRGRVEARLPFRPELANGTGFSHGGMVMTVLDYVMASAARYSGDDIRAVSTIDMTTSFLAGTNADLVVVGTVLRAGRTVAFCEAQARNAAGELVAKASGTISVRRNG